MNEEETIIRNLEDKVSKIRDEHREVVKDLVRTHEHLQISQGELLETKIRLEISEKLLHRIRSAYLKLVNYETELTAEIENFLKEENKQ